MINFVKSSFGSMETSSLDVSYISSAFVWLKLYFLRLHLTGRAVKVSIYSRIDLM